AVFDKLPWTELPLDSFVPPPPRRSIIDSLAPTADAPSMPPAPAVAPLVKRRHKRTYAAVAGLAAALGVLVGVSVQRNRSAMLVDDQVWIATTRLAALSAPVEATPRAEPMVVTSTSKPSAKSVKAAPSTSKAVAARPFEAPRIEA